MLENRFLSAVKALRSRNYVTKKLLSAGYSACYEYDGGVSLALDPSCDQDLNFSMLWRSQCEPLKRLIISKLITSGCLDNTCILDVGAYIGDNSLPWLALISSLAKSIEVWAVDPCKENVSFMRATAAYNSLQLKAICSVISNRNANYTPRESWSHSPFQVSDVHSKSSIESITVDSIYTTSKHSRPGLFHIDVEGMEYEVLSGAMQTLSRYNPIVIYELHLNDLNYLQTSAMLRGLNYTLFTINEIIAGNRPDCRNIVAIPSDRVSILKYSFFCQPCPRVANYYPIALGNPLIPYDY